MHGSRGCDPAFVVLLYVKPRSTVARRRHIKSQICRRQNTQTCMQGHAGNHTLPQCTLRPRCVRLAQGAGLDACQSQTHRQQQQRLGSQNHRHSKTRAGSSRYTELTTLLCTNNTDAAADRTACSKIVLLFLLLLMRNHGDDGIVPPPTAGVSAAADASPSAVSTLPSSPPPSSASETPSAVSSV